MRRRGIDAGVLGDSGAHGCPLPRSARRAEIEGRDAAAARVGVVGLSRVRDAILPLARGMVRAGRGCGDATLPLAREMVCAVADAPTRFCRLRDSRYGERRAL